jgi:MazG family protein
MDTKLKAFERLLNVMDELREKCPWDREQTFESLRNNTIEETYELADAIITNDMSEIKKELGDLLLHIVFYSKIASEIKAFNITDVINSLCDKLIYRHPHVFGNIDVDGAREVEQNWEALKLKEKGRKNSVLEGVPVSLPAIVKAYRIQEKASAVGFDWDKKEQVWEKVKEEIDELQTEIINNEMINIESEFGDLLFSLINMARLYKIDPEAALERTNLKFIKRFNYIENQTIKQGVSLKDITLDEMDKFWNEAKKLSE